MNKYVRRETAANMFNRFYHMYDHLLIKSLIMDMKQAFFELPTEDVRHVVRCRDCVTVKTTDCGSFCLANDEGVAYNDTCPFGDNSEEHGEDL